MDVDKKKSVTNKVINRIFIVVALCSLVITLLVVFAPIFLKTEQSNEAMDSGNGTMTSEEAIKAVKDYPELNNIIINQAVPNNGYSASVTISSTPSAKKQSDGSYNFFCNITIQYYVYNDFLGIDERKIKHCTLRANVSSYGVVSNIAVSN